MLQPGSRSHFSGPPDENTFRILISTDNHAGYAESDPIRREDSFRTLEEIFMIAKENDVDFVLIGGDLYHYNTPSRYSHWRVADIFRKYCLGESRVTFDVSEDSLVMFPDGKLNYHDPSLSISLPVFAIHGNHDDPSGTPALSAMDLLHQCRMLNYFGKFATADEIVVHPLKLRKGNTHLCIYGFGNIRDERLRQTIDQRRLTWVESDLNDSVNIALIHQNRYNRGQGNHYMPEEAFPNFLHSIVWCHEHESILQHGVSTSGASIIQPGSSVATSLSESEVPEKHVAIMEVRGSAEHIPITMVALKTVRPFELQDLALSENGLPPGDKCTEQQVIELIEQAIEKLIVSANTSFASREPPGPLELSDAILNEARGNAMGAGPMNGGGATPQNASSSSSSSSGPSASASNILANGIRDTQPLPLIRIRVDAFGGYPKPASIKFAPKFQGRVANPESLVTYLRGKGSGSNSKSTTQNADGAEAKDEKHGQLSGDDERAIFSLIHEEIAKMGGLHALSERFMADALRDFAEKGAQTISTSLKGYGEKLSEFVHTLTSPAETFSSQNDSGRKPYELIGRFQPVDDETIRRVSKAYAESHEQGGNASIPHVLPPQERVDPTPAMLAVATSSHASLAASMGLNSSQNEPLSTEPATKRKQTTTTKSESLKPSRAATAAAAAAATKAGTMKIKQDPARPTGLVFTSSATQQTLLPSPAMSVHNNQENNDDDELVIDKVVQMGNSSGRSKNLLPAPAPFASLSGMFGGESKSGTQSSQLAWQPVPVRSARTKTKEVIDIPDEGEGGESMLAKLDEQGAKRIQMYRATGCGHDAGTHSTAITRGHAHCAHDSAYSTAKFHEDKTLIQQQFTGGMKKNSRVSGGVSSQQPSLLLMPTQVTRATQSFDEL